MVLHGEKLNKDEMETRSRFCQYRRQEAILACDPHLIRSPEGDRYWILNRPSLQKAADPAEADGINTEPVRTLLCGIYRSCELSEPQPYTQGLDEAGCVWAGSHFMMKRPVIMLCTGS